MLLSYLIMEHPIIKKIEQLILEKISEERIKLKVGEYHASMIGLCLRRLWYIYNNLDNYTVEEKRLRIFESGRIYHSWLGELLTKIATVIREGQIRKKIDSDGEEITFIGTFDDLIMIKTKETLSEENAYIIEVKTVSRLGFSKPMDHHIIQLNAYLNLLDVRDGFIIYIDRDKLQTKSFHIVKDEKLYEKTIERVKTLHKHIISGTIPFPESMFDKEREWECAFCDFRDSCLKDIENRIKQDV